MAVAAEFKRAERGRCSDLIGDDVIEGAVQRPGGGFDGEGRRAAEETRSALGVNVGAILKGAIEAGDQRDFVLNLFQRLERGREFERSQTRG